LICGFSKIRNSYTKKLNYGNEKVKNVNEKGIKIKKFHDLSKINQFSAPKALNT